MSGIDLTHEGGDYITENGVRKKVGFSTAETTANPMLAIKTDQVSLIDAPVSPLEVVGPVVNKSDNKPNKKEA